jgi:hypothetical protein
VSHDSTSPVPPLPRGEGAGGPAALQRSTSGRSTILTLLAALPWLLLLFQLLLVVPRYQRLFHEHGLKTPAFTSAILDVSMWVRGHTFIAVGITLVLIFATVGVVLAAQAGLVSKRIRYLFLTLAFAIPCGLFVLSWVGVMGTHRTLVEGLKK